MDCFLEETLDYVLGHILPDLHDLVHVIDPFVLILLKLSDELLVELVSKNLQIPVGFELRKTAFVTNDSQNFLSCFLGKLISFAFLAVPVVLFNSQSEFPWTYRTPTIHEGTVGFAFNDDFVKTVENWFHVHDFEVALKFYKSLHFLFLL